MSYDYTIIGAGLYGAVVAYELGKAGKNVLVVERKDHIGGTVYTENILGINVHEYGAHIFRTDDKDIWNYINQFAEFNNFINTPKAYYRGHLYSLPFNMNTFRELWDIVTPAEAEAIIDEQRIANINPENLEEYVLDAVGTDIYYKLIQGYTEKQWGRPCDELPPDLMKRIPIRFTYNNNYYDKRYQGVPIGGYTQIIEKMLEQATVFTNTDATDLNIHDNQKIIYTGCIDEFFGYEFGELEYRSLEFKTKVDSDDTQGVAVINFTDAEVPYTRCIEHKYFENVDTDHVIQTYEYPHVVDKNHEKYYPVPTDENLHLYKIYKEYAETEYPNIIFCGRLGEYKYYDMEDTIKSALSTCRNILNNVV